MSKHRLFQRALKTLGVGAGAFVLMVGSAFSQGLCLDGLSESCGCGAGLSVCDDDGVGSIFDSATSVWAFNDPADLGADSVGSNDLTLVNVPTATGGALGYAAKFDGLNQTANVSDNAALSVGDVDWALSFWAQTDTTTAINADRWVAKSPGAGPIEYEVYASANIGDPAYLIASYQDAGSGVESVTSAVALATSTRYHVLVWHDAAANTLSISVNGETPVTATSVDPTVDRDGDFAIARRGSIAASYGDISVSTALFFNGSFPDASGRAALYDSGKGSTCADNTVTTDAVACWPMTEDGGPYLDSIGSNDLTAVNVPTRAAGLVEQSDSGMAVHLVDATDTYLTYNSAPTPFADINATGELTVSFWVNRRAGANRAYLVPYNSDTFAQWQINDFGSTTGIYIRVYDGAATECQALLPGQTLNAWHMMTVRMTTSSIDASTDGRANEVSCTPTAWTPNDMSTGGGAKYFRIGAWTSFSVDADMDNVAFWGRILTNAEEDTLYNSGAGTFYAAIWDAIFNGPRFAWSKKPERRRITWQ